MNPQTWWYVARASGIVAWAALSLSVISGLLLSTRMAKGRPGPAWWSDLHRFLAGTGLALTALHLAGLVADSYVTFDLADLLVPFAADWQPGPVALGVVALHLVLAAQVTSLFMRRLPRRLWRTVHVGTVVAFWSATFHFLTAGSEKDLLAVRVAATVAMLAVVFLTLVRALTLGQRGSARRSRSTSSAMATPSSAAARSYGASRTSSGQVATSSSAQTTQRATVA